MSKESSFKVSKELKRMRNQFTDIQWKIMVNAEKSYIENRNKKLKEKVTEDK